jgi:2-oxoglutarate/2-oxoacid ferredoxin oxidoreductase subunit alpha
VPGPLVEKAAQPTKAGVLWYGSTGAPMAEALAALEKRGIHLDRCRVRAFPFADGIADFVAEHDRVFVVEQNRDAQLRGMLVNELGIAPDKLVAVLHYDGTPLTARFVEREIAEKAALFNVVPLKKVAN